MTISAEISIIYVECFSKLAYKYLQSTIIIKNNQKSNEKSNVYFKKSIKNITPKKFNHVFI